MRLSRWIAACAAFSFGCCQLETLHLRVHGESSLTYSEYNIERLSIDTKGTLILQHPNFIEVSKEFRNHGTYVELHNAPSGALEEIPGTHLRASSIFVNSGLFVYEASEYHTAPRAWLGSTEWFVNTGILWFWIGGSQRLMNTPEPVEPSRYLQDPDLLIRASTEMLNTGKIILRGRGSHQLVAKIEVKADNPRSIVNKGTIYVENTHLVIKNGFTGDGCIAIRGDTTIILGNPNQFDSKQIIFLNAQSSPILLKVWIEDPTFDLTVAGLTSLSLIRFFSQMHMGVESRGGKFYFGLDPEKMTATITLEGLEKEDVTFDGKTLTAKTDQNQHVPKQCDLAVNEVDHEVEKYRARG